MNVTNEFYSFALDFLFVIGVLLVPVGVSFMLIPNKVFNIANKLNRWVATDSFFNKLDTPIYKERFFYRHHQLFGFTVLLVSAVCLFMLTVYTVKLAESEFEKWLFHVLYYMLIVAIMLAFLFGLIMFIRPSALKSFETWGNRWIDTEEPLKMLDQNKNLPDRILPGNPRVFGLAVTLAAIYIIWNVNPL